jgi:hypothetical protein
VGVEANEQHHSDSTMRYVAGVGTSVRVGTSPKPRSALHMYQMTVLTTVEVLSTASGVKMIAHGWDDA